MNWLKLNKVGIFTRNKYDCRAPYSKVVAWSANFKTIFLIFRGNEEKNYIVSFYQIYRFQYFNSVPLKKMSQYTPYSTYEQTKTLEPKVLNVYIVIQCLQINSKN